MNLTRRSCPARPEKGAHSTSSRALGRSLPQRSSKAMWLAFKMFDVRAHQPQNENRFTRLEQKAGPSPPYRLAGKRLQLAVRGCHLRILQLVLQGLHSAQSRVDLHRAAGFVGLSTELGTCIHSWLGKSVPSILQHLTCLLDVPPGNVLLQQ